MDKPFFLDISPETARDGASPYAVLPLPCERTVTYGTGTARGPDAVLRASREIEDFDEELLVRTGLAVQTLNAPSINRESSAENLRAIKNTAEPVFQSGRFLMGLGGEHTVSLPLIEAAAKHSSGLAVLCFDAHLDLRKKYQGTEYSHACVMRRVRELNVPTVHLGARSWSSAEYDYVKEQSVPVISAERTHAEPLEKLSDGILELLPGKVYISFDMDVFDPALVPGTGTPEPGGLDWRTVLFLLRKVIADRKVVGADIVEVSPVPGTQVSEFVAARLAAKILTYHKHRNLL
ncbi:MAG: agmatinase [Kiritimatiellia bacterium]